MFHDDAKFLRLLETDFPQKSLWSCEPCASHLWAILKSGIMLKLFLEMRSACLHFFIHTIFIVVGILKRSSGENRLIISFLLLNGV